MKLILANPRGFCAGVDRAIHIVERALEQLGAPIYVKHEIVHNVPEVRRLRAMGAIFTDDIGSVPEGSTLVFSAHGVSLAIRQQAAARNLTIFDATCPLVTKVHCEVAASARQGMECVLIGHAGHPEVEGTLGQYRLDPQTEAGIYLVECVKDAERLTLQRPDHCCYVTQTTLSIEDTAQVIAVLRKRFPAIQGPKTEDICYATTNRQRAVAALAPQCDLMIVVGSETSSNSTRLKEIAERLGCRTYLLDHPDALDRAWFLDQGEGTVGITAGASAPEYSVQAIVERLCEWGAHLVESQAGPQETITFALPKVLRRPPPNVNE